MTDPFDDLNARLIERLYLEDLQEISSRSQHETSTRLQNEDFDLEEEQEFEEAIRLSRQTFQEESLQRATGGHDYTSRGESSRQGAAPERRHTHHRPNIHDHSHNRHQPPQRQVQPDHRHEPARRDAPGSEPTEGECVICADTFNTSELFRPSGCNSTNPRNYYCTDCMKMAFEGALRDEARFPVRCCPAAGPFDIRQVRNHFDAEFLRQYVHREREMSTRNRIYCHRPTCSAFLFGNDIEGDKATCGACGHHTCTRCKEKYHPESTCPEEDKDVQATIKLGKEEAWQRCPECSDMVDLHSGCNHIWCRCGTHFCFECGAKWKTCECPIMGNHRLGPAELDHRGEREAMRVWNEEQARRERDGREEELAQVRMIDVEDGSDRRLQQRLTDFDRQQRLDRGNRVQRREEQERTGNLEARARDDTWLHPESMVPRDRAIAAERRQAAQGAPERGRHWQVEQERRLPNRPPQRRDAPMWVSEEDRIARDNAIEQLRRMYGPSDNLR